MSRTEPKEVSNIVVRWIRRAMEVNKFLKPGNNIAEIVKKCLICVETRVDEGDSVLCGVVVILRLCREM